MNTIDVIVKTYDTSDAEMEYDSLTIVDADNITITFSDNADGKAVIFGTGTAV